MGSNLAAVTASRGTRSAAATAETRPPPHRSDSLDASAPPPPTLGKNSAVDEDLLIEVKICSDETLRMHGE